MNKTVTIPQRNTSNRNRTYGGAIYFSDFNTVASNESAISRIDDMMRFDEQRKRDCKLRGWL